MPGAGGDKNHPKSAGRGAVCGTGPTQDSVHGEGTGPGSAPAPQALLSPSKGWGPSLSPSKGWGPSLSPQEPLDRAEPPQGCFGEQEQH